MRLLNKVSLSIVVFFFLLTACMSLSSTGIIASQSIPLTLSEGGVEPLTEEDGGLTVSHPESCPPYEQTEPLLVDVICDMAEITCDDVVYDLGSGDGRLAIEAARRIKKLCDDGQSPSSPAFSSARVIGFERRRDLVALSTRLAAEAGVSELVEFRQADMAAANFSLASVVLVYTIPEMLIRLAPRLFDQMAPGSRIVSHDYLLPTQQTYLEEVSWESTRKKKKQITHSTRTTLHKYRVGAWKTAAPSGGIGWNGSVIFEFPPLTLRDGEKDSDDGYRMVAINNSGSSSGKSNNSDIIIIISPYTEHPVYAGNRVRGEFLRWNKILRIPNPAFVESGGDIPFSVEPDASLAKAERKVLKNRVKLLDFYFVVTVEARKNGDLFFVWLQPFRNVDLSTERFYDQFEIRVRVGDKVFMQWARPKPLLDRVLVDSNDGSVDDRPYLWTFDEAVSIGSSGLVLTVETRPIV